MKPTAEVFKLYKEKPWSLRKRRAYIPLLRLQNKHLLIFLKTKMSYFQKDEITACEHVEKRELLHTFGRNVHWCNHHRTSMEGPQKIRLGLPYNPEIPLLGIYPKKLKSGSQRDICTPMFI